MTEPKKHNPQSTEKELGGRTAANAFKGGRPLQEGLRPAQTDTPTAAPVAQKPGSGVPPKNEKE
jgi:hypothetical protein